MKYVLLMLIALRQLLKHLKNHKQMQTTLKPLKSK